MTDPQTQREKTSLHQLTSVSQARQIRLQTQRQALAERERLMAQAWESQHLDESLLGQQRAAWASRRQAWAQEGGAMRLAVSSRQDRELLTDMAALLARKRAAVQSDADQLAQDISAWALRWRGAQAFEESLTTREKALRVSVERATERQRDEDTLTIFTAPQAAAACVAA